jgi:hypothetical protein
MRPIDADELVKLLYKNIEIFEPLSVIDKDVQNAIARIKCDIEIVESMPTVEQTITSFVHGHWIKLDEDGYDVTYKCSHCNTCFYGVVDPCNDLCNFCLACGAKMDESEVEE